MTTSRSGLGAAVAGIVLLAVGFAIGLVTAGWAPSATADRADREVGTRTDQVDGRLETRVTFEPAPTSPVRSPTSGRISASGCVVGATVGNGTVIATVDGQPVIGLDVPSLLYRDIGDDTAGRDVGVLRNALRSLGFDSSGSADQVDPALSRSIDAFNARFGITAPPGTFLAVSTTPLPPGGGAVRACPVGIGQRVEPGDVLASVATGADRLRIDGALTPLLLGAPVQLEFVGGTRVEAAAGAQVYDDPAVVAAYLAAGAPDESNEGPVPGATGDDSTSAPSQVVITLRTPIDALVVPIAALAADDAGSCTLVMTEPRHATVPVRVLTIVAGTAYVAPDQPQVRPSRVRLSPRRGSSGCR